MTSNSNETVLAYERVRPEYVRFTNKLKVLFEELLKAKAIDFHLLESRTKEVASLRDKIGRPGKTYSDPLTEITDLVGIRVITYYQDAANEVAKLIASEFQIDQENSVIHSSSAAEFGYKSAHFVITLNSARAELLEWNSFSDISAEIQVRTVLQHAWAAISHKLQYKREDDVPVILKRKLFRLSALFELADDEFVSLRDASGQVTEEITALVKSGERQLAIDYISLGNLIDTSPVVAEICAYAAEVGFDFDGDDVGPDDDEDGGDALSDLIQFAGIANIGTIDSFEKALESSLSWAKSYLGAQFNYSGKTAKARWYVTPAFICQLVLICISVKHYRLGHLLKLGYHHSIASRVYDIAVKFSLSGTNVSSQGELV